MGIVDLFSRVIAMIWEGMNTIIVPVLNISVTKMLLGLFIACVAIQILNPLLGIGASLVDSFSSGVRRSSSRAHARARARSSKEYSGNPEALLRAYNKRNNS